MIATCAPCKGIASGPAGLKGTYDLYQVDHQYTKGRFETFSFTQQKTKICEWHGTYFQDQHISTDPVCKDLCVYRKEDQLFCFARGGHTSLFCQQENAPLCDNMLQQLKHDGGDLQ